MRPETIPKSMPNQCQHHTRKSDAKINGKTVKILPKVYRFSTRSQEKWSLETNTENVVWNDGFLETGSGMEAAMRAKTPGRPGPNICIDIYSVIYYYYIFYGKFYLVVKRPMLYHISILYYTPYSIPCVITPCRHYVITSIRHDVSPPRCEYAKTSIRQVVNGR